MNILIFHTSTGVHYSIEYGALNILIFHTSTGVHYLNSQLFSYILSGMPK